MSSAGGYPENPLKADELFGVLSHHARRELVFYFESAAPDDTASIDEVVGHIDTRVPSSNRAELRNSLQHAHLPKLVENGWVDYDARTGEIRYLGHDFAAPLLTDITAVFEE